MPGNDSHGKPDEHVEILDVSEYNPRKVRNIVVYNKWDVSLIPPYFLSSPGTTHSILTVFTFLGK